MRCTQWGCNQCTHNCTGVNTILTFVHILYSPKLPLAISRYKRSEKRPSFNQSWNAAFGINVTSHPVTVFTALSGENDVPFAETKKMQLDVDVNPPVFSNTECTCNDLRIPDTYESKIITPRYCIFAQWHQFANVGKMAY